MPRRVKLDQLGVKFWALSKEDFIIAKLVYEGYQDYMDALACWIRYENELDVDYLSKMADLLEINNLLNAIRKKEPVEDVFTD